ncbi:MAG: manganese efflux pump [Acidobacteria bacterium]|nr:manganese efflux pump [Acidobacteriota bacterium]
MNIWVLLGTAVALAMDAFAVALATGLHVERVGFRRTFRLAWHFGLFQALMPIAGWSLGAGVHSLVLEIDHWVAFALLAFVGGKMTAGAFHRSGERRPVADPTRGGSLVMLSFATSLDALAVGFSLSMLRVSIWRPAAVIGAVAAAITAAGLHLGRFLGRGSRLDRYAEVFGGLILLGIGLAILRDHGVW